MLLPLLLFAFILAGCSRTKNPAAAAENGFPGENAVRKEYERGPLRVEVHLSETEITIAGRLRLQITARIATKYELELPAFGEKLDQFAIVDYRTPPPRLLADDILERRREYTLEPLLSGEYIIPPMSIRFREKSEDSVLEAKTHTLETEEIKVTVTSLLPADLEKLEIHGMAPPVPLPRSQLHRTWLPILYGVLALLLLICACVLLARHKRQLAAVRLPAHVIAYSRLETLTAAKLIEQGQIKEFYLRISAILRHFIEDRFGLHAPERTTEEFLLEIQDGRLSETNRNLLQEFLGGCDLVKFAEHIPAASEIQHTFNLCRQFVEANEEPVEQDKPTPPEAA